MTIPTPAPHTVTAIFDDGPCQGETQSLPWGRLEIRVPVGWNEEGTDTVDVLYRLVPPWRGQPTCHYRLVVESVERAA